MANKNWIEKAIIVVKFIVALAPYIKDIFDLINSLSDEFDKLDEDTQSKVARVAKILEE